MPEKAGRREQVEAEEETAPMVLGKPMVVPVDPSAVDRRLLVEVLGIEDYESILREAVDLATRALGSYAKSGLGYIIPPQLPDMVEDRFEQMMLAEMEEIREMLDKLESVEGPQEMREKLVRLLRRFVVAVLAAREFRNMMTTILYLNLPSRVRPSLANVKIGFDLV